jgi:hypothetical protein
LSCIAGGEELQSARLVSVSRNTLTAEYFTGRCKICVESRGVTLEPGALASLFFMGDVLYPLNLSSFPLAIKLIGEIYG